MASKIYRLSSSAALVVLRYFLWVMLVINYNPHHCSASVVAVFVLGGFSSDVGTNNYLNTTLKANQPFNGIDYPGNVPTGRFSNGVVLVDVIASWFGFNSSPPPFFTLQYSGDLAGGVLAAGGANMASAGGGVINSIPGALPLGVQLAQLLTIFGNLTARLGPQAAASYLNQSLCVLSPGSADIVVQARDATADTDQVFLARLVLEIVRYIRTIYANGVRRFAIVTPPPLGCSPYGRTLNPDGQGNCFARANSLVERFVDRLNVAMELQSLSTPGLVYAIGNAYRVDFLHINNPTPFGFVNVTDACCGTGTSPCTPTSRLCGNREVRNRYLFWSQWQLTEYAARSTAQFFYGAVAGELVYPITFRQLAES